MRYLLALIFSLLPLALGQTSFPLLLSYDSSLKQQPAFTSFASLMATASVGSDASAEFSSASNDPLYLASALMAVVTETATTTPAWFTEIPTPLQSYVSSIAVAEASIIGSESKGGAERVEAKVAIMGSLLAAMLVGMLLL
jgi:hypothetical protein